jgi:uncharacterized membrane protein
VTVVSPRELEDKLTETLQPMLRPGELPRARASITAVVKTSVHQGPIPSPRQFGEYNEILPGSADRILSMAEKEQGHRHQWERRHLIGDVITNFVQLLLGFALSLALIGGAVYCAKDAPWVAGLLVSVSAFGLVGAFIKGRRLFGKADHDVPSVPDKTAAKGGKGNRRNKRN